MCHMARYEEIQNGMKSIDLTTRASGTDAAGQKQNETEKLKQYGGLPSRPTKGTTPGAQEPREKQEEAGQWPAPRGQREGQRTRKTPLEAQEAKNRTEATGA